MVAVFARNLTKNLALFLITLSCRTKDSIELAVSFLDTASKLKYLIKAIRCVSIIHNQIYTKLIFYTLHASVDLFHIYASLYKLFHLKALTVKTCNSSCQICNIIGCRYVCLNVISCAFGLSTSLFGKHKVKFRTSSTHA